MTDTDATDSESNANDTAFLRIQPADAAVDAGAVEQAFVNLHAMDVGRGRFLSRAASTDATVEVRLATDGDASVEYHVGVSPPEHADALERAVRKALPRAYDVTTVEATLADLLGLPPTTDEDTSDEEADRIVPLPAEWDAAGVTFEGVGDRSYDWATTLPPLTPNDEHRAPSYPLTDVATALADAETPAAFQVVLQPKGDWRATADDIQFRAEHENTLAGHVADFIFGLPDPEDRTLSNATKERLEAIDAKDAQHSFTVNARAVAVGPDAATTERTVAALRSTFSGLAGPCYRVEPTVAAYGSDDANTILDRLRDRAVREEPSFTRRLRMRLPVTRNASPAIVADASSVGHFVVLDGESLPPAADRAIDTTPTERTGQPLPPRDTLARYLDTDSMPLGVPLTADREPLDATVALPPDLQQLHTAVFGASGSGKSVLLLSMALQNHGATDGATVYLDSKGDGHVEQYLQAHYATYGDLEDVYYFDCADVLPAVSVLTIEPLLDAGIGREQAVETVATHYTDLLTGFMGEDRYEAAVRSPDVIHYLVKALFDPVHGDDTISHYDLERAVTRLKQTGEPPAVTDDRLREQLAGVATTHQRSLDRVLAGVATRIEKATRDSRLGTLFDHIPTTAGPAFDLRDVLDEDCVVVLDTSGYRDAPHRMLTLLVLSQLWTALKRRHADTPDDADRPLVNLFVEEAADVAQSGILADLLSQGRSFGLGVTLAMQFPGQLRADHPRVYRELLNDVGTVVAGRVGVDDDLAARYATDAIPAPAVANRLRALDRGEWLVRLPAPFADDTPQPFRCAALPLPPGHPDGNDPLTAAQQAAADAQIAMTADRTAREHGLHVGSPGVATADSDAATADADAAAGTAAAADASGATAADTAGGGTATAAADATTQAPQPVTTALRFTDRMPPTVRYEAGADAIACTQCDRRFERSVDGMRRAIDCCHDLDAVDRDDVPIIDLPLKLTPDEIAASDYTDRQLALLQAVHVAQHRGYHDLEYDLVRDSMLRLREYVGIDHDAVTDLVDDGLLRDDCDYPHKLYSVSPAGRDAINAPLQEGIDYGDGIGDLSESSEHAMAVDLGVTLIDRVFAADPDSPVVDAVSYHPLDDDTRLDAAGLDHDGDVIVALEAERTTHDLADGVPADYDKMARCNPDHAIWITMDRDGGHAVLRALNDPADGRPRVTKTYSTGTPPRQFSIDQPGCTQIYTVANVKNMLDR